MTNLLSSKRSTTDLLKAQNMPLEAILWDIFYEEIKDEVEQLESKKKSRQKIAAFLYILTTSGCRQIQLPNPDVAKIGVSDPPSGGCCCFKASKDNLRMKK